MKWSGGGSVILLELPGSAGAFAQWNNGWHSWSSDIMVMASGETYEIILDTCGKIKMGNLEESSSVSHAWGLGCEDRGYLSIAVWRVAGLGGRRTRQVVWCGALQPFRLITPAPDALQAPLLQELQIMHDTQLISHIRHIQTFNYIHRKLFGEHIFCPLTSRTLWFKSSKACFVLHKIIFEAITVNLNV